MKERATMALAAGALGAAMVPPTAAAQGELSVEYEVVCDQEEPRVGRGGPLALREAFTALADTRRGCETWTLEATITHPDGTVTTVQSDGSG